jgi:hypothetical protein
VARGAATVVRWAMDTPAVRAQVAAEARKRRAVGHQAGTGLPRPLGGSGAEVSGDSPRLVMIWTCDASRVLAIGP